jgi:Calcineurin-like phosphoesterase
MSRNHRAKQQVKAPVRLAPALVTVLLAGGLAVAVYAQRPQSVAKTKDDSSVIHIGIIGDQTSSPDIPASYAVLQQGVAALSRQNLDVVLHVGDLVESTLNPSQVTALWQQATGILDRLPVPWYMTAGDHDVSPPVFQQVSPDHSREQLFQQLYGARVPAVLAHPYYSFDLRGFHFISLYSFGALDSDSRFGNVFLSQVYDDQYQFLRRDLAAHRHARAVIVWVHQPLWYHASGWQRVHELLRRYRVAAVISGHLHYNQDGGTVDGIRYLTIGATGALKKVGSRQAGDVDNVWVVDVRRPGRVSVKLIPLDDQPLRLTPRLDMDRVQALDVQLGNFFDFPAVNGIFVKAGQLLNSCAGTKPASIQVAEIGNPIDLPLDVKIEFSSSDSAMSLSSPGFTAGVCQTVIGDTECVLPPTARAFTSNYSSVDINPGPPPLWKTELASGNPRAGTVLSFRVTTSFVGTSGPLELHTTVSTKVEPCP